MIAAKFDTLALVFCSLAILTWGLWGFFGKLGLERGMAPMSVLTAELLIGGIGAAALLVASTVRHGSPAAIFQDWNVFGVCSATALLLGLVFFYLALAREPVSLVVPLTASYPAVAVLLSYALLGDHPSLPQWLGLVLVVVGAGLLLSGASPGGAR